MIIEQALLDKIQTHNLELLERFSISALGQCLPEMVRFCNRMHRLEQAAAKRGMFDLEHGASRARQHWEMRKMHEEFGVKQETRQIMRQLSVP